MAINLPDISTYAAKTLSTVEQRIEESIESIEKVITENFSSRCPTSEELKKLVSLKNNILKKTIKYQKKVNQIQKLVNPLKVLTTTLNTALRVFQALPAPNIGTTVGITTTVSLKAQEVVDALEKLKKQGSLIESFSRDINQGSVKNIEEVFNRFDQLVLVCTKNPLTNLQSAEEINKTLKTTSRTGTVGRGESVIEGIESNQSKVFQVETGETYTVEVLTESYLESTEIPRRYAQVKDSTGVVVLKGPLSFTSDSSILIEELQFRLKNKLS